ncbi:type II toxin-antitoxin system RelE/ParE family toxin [Holophaga foetida]|uniref:type II toxin-antitoxin system RelE/ParE family toxin n=1 Tax=Holophaga foetida TaxID=35839 RepID=UPI00130E7C61|nr:type II toxin-antitoxin system RelE/ParE family toxin [Holophaga foetida]
MRALPILWSQGAEDSLHRILTYIEAENPIAARYLWLKVTEAITRAAEFPEMAPHVGELDRSYREILGVRPFRVVYRVEAGALRIVTVLRQEQDYDPARFLVD